MFEGMALVWFCVYASLWFLSFNDKNVRKFMIYSHLAIIAVIIVIMNW